MNTFGLHVLHIGRLLMWLVKFIHFKLDKWLQYINQSEYEIWLYGEITDAHTMPHMGTQMSHTCVHRQTDGQIDRHTHRQTHLVSK